MSQLKINLTDLGRSFKIVLVIFTQIPCLENCVKTIKFLQQFDTFKQ